MNNITIYHNPRCSKSRQALQLLLDAGVEPTVIEYMKEPFTRSSLKELLKKLGMKASELVRTNEALYKELGPETEAAILDAMVTHPKLIQRAIVVTDNKAVLGRPPEKILTLL